MTSAGEMPAAQAAAAAAVEAALQALELTPERPAPGAIWSGSRASGSSRP